MRDTIDGDRDIVASHSSRWFSLTIRALRVSPDERYLAYIMGKVLITPIPLPAPDHVRIVDLETREEKRLPRKYGLMTNLVWSRDGTRLYFGGINPDKGGIYVVTVKELFD